MTTGTVTVPTYVPTPGGCPINPTYAVSPCVWATCAPTTEITYGSTDCAIAGSTTFTVTATDSYSSLTNSDVTFNIVVVTADATSITIATAPNASYDYRVGDTKLVIPVPTYTHSPACSSVFYSYSMVVDPGFVTINGSNIEVYTTDGTSTGVYSTVTVRTTDSQSGLTDDQTF